MRDSIHFAVASAMRVSEICRIRWADLTSRTARCGSAIASIPQQKPGNDSDVPLLDFCGHDAFEIVKRQPRTKECIFPFNPRTVGKYFIDAANFLEIEDLNFHDLRHEAVSRMFESEHKYSIPEVALVSGHKDWGICAVHQFARSRSASAAAAVNNSIRRRHNLGKIRGEGRALEQRRITRLIKKLREGKADLWDDDIDLLCAPWI